MKHLLAYLNGGMPGNVSRPLLSTFIWIYEIKVHRNMHAQNLTRLHISARTLFFQFVPTPTFRMKVANSVIHEAPGLFKKGSVERV